MMMLASVCWNVFGRIHIKMQTNSVANQALNQDMNPMSEVRPNFRRYNIPILKLNSVAFATIFMSTLYHADYFLFFSLQSTSLKCWLMIGKELLTASLFCTFLFVKHPIKDHLVKNVCPISYCHQNRIHDVNI